MEGGVERSIRVNELDLSAVRRIFRTRIAHAQTRGRKTADDILAVASTKCVGKLYVRIGVIIRILGAVREDVPVVRRIPVEPGHEQTPVAKAGKSEGQKIQAQRTSGIERADRIKGGVEISGRRKPAEIMGNRRMEGIYSVRIEPNYRRAIRLPGETA